MQWDGKYVAVGDADTAMIYRVSAAGKIKGSLALTGADYVNQFWIESSASKTRGHGATAIAPSQDGGVVGYYQYPAGGAAMTTISVSEPFGATVSN